MKRARRTKGIATLLHPLPLETFLDKYWPHRPLVMHGALARLRAIAACPELESLHTMLQAKRRSSRIWVKDPRTGAHRAVLVTTAQAEDLYASEALTVSIDQIEVPAISRLLADMAADLRVPASRLSCNLYVSPGGKGTTALHFDNHEVFAIQIRGRKRWQFAPNTHVPSPLDDYAVGTQASPALRRICGGDFPDRLPESARTVVLAPGSVLFLPKGYWHLTHTLEASVHLTLAVDSLAWVDVVMGQVRDRLVRDEGWRRTPGVLRGRGPRQEKTRQELSMLLGGLARALGALDAAQLAQSPYAAADAQRSS
jgi:50S ribosomal protein L16 3-hydroxylase